VLIAGGRYTPEVNAQVNTKLLKTCEVVSVMRHAQEPAGNERDDLRIMPSFYALRVPKARGPKNR